MRGIPDPITNAGRWLYRQWMRFAHVLAVINTAVLLTLIYIVVIGPGFVVTRLLGIDSLDRSMKPKASYWRPRERARHQLEDVKRQF